MRDELRTRKRILDWMVLNDIRRSDQVAQITKKKKQDIFDSVIRIGEQKNWLTTYVTEKVFGKNGS